MVIPAHQEAAVLGRCLAALLDGPLTLDVVVVANACTDATAQVARDHGVRVIETPTPGKAHALNLGDQACTTFPRAYVDADVLLPQACLAACLVALQGPAHVVAPALTVDLAKASRGVRAWYRVWTALPYITDDLIGSGVYVLSEAGRARFASFPEATGDDTFVRRLFAPPERASVRGVSFTVFPPQTLRTLVRVKSRVAAGNAEQGAARSSSVQALRHRPDLWRDVPVYVAVTLLARVRGRRSARSGTIAWFRDETSR